MKTVRFLNEDCTVSFAHYDSNHQLAIELACEDGSPMAMATVCTGDFFDEEHTAIKDWSENEGMLKALTEAGIIEDTGKTISMGFVQAHVVKVLVKVPTYVHK